MDDRPVDRENLRELEPQARKKWTARRDGVGESGVRLRRTQKNGMNPVYGALRDPSSVDRF